MYVFNRLIFQSVCQKAKNRKAMFTFNSQQLSEMQAPLHKKIKVIESYRRQVQIMRYRHKHPTVDSSKFTSFTEENLNKSFNSAGNQDYHHLKSVQSDQIHSLDDQLIHSLSRKNSQKTDVQTNQYDSKHTHSFLNKIKRHKLKKQMEEICQAGFQKISPTNLTINQQNDFKQIQNQSEEKRFLSFQIKERRSSSLRASPKIGIPYSDKKLPKVFRIKFEKENLVLPRKRIESQRVKEHKVGNDSMFNMTFSKQIFNQTKNTLQKVPQSAALENSPRNRRYYHSSADKMITGVEGFHKIVEMQNKLFDRIYKINKQIMLEEEKQNVKKNE